MAATTVLNFIKSVILGNSDGCMTNVYLHIKTDTIFNFQRECSFRRMVMLVWADHSWHKSVQGYICLYKSVQGYTCLCISKMAVTAAPPSYILPKLGYWPTTPAVDMGQIKIEKM